MSANVGSKSYEGAQKGAQRPEPVFCPGCGNEIDPDCCGCGEMREGHNAWWLGHGFVAIGCDCLRSEAA
jgi:hypothetical protein